MLTGKENEHHRRRLAAHFVQRRRADIEHYLDSDTPFPKRIPAETTHHLSPEYKELFDKVLRFISERVHDKTLSKFRQRVRWWSALALLRCLGSNRLVTVEDGWPFAGIGAELAMVVMEQAFDWLDAPVVRVTGADVPMPYAANLERLALPQVATIAAAARTVLGRS